MRVVCWTVSIYSPIRATSYALVELNGLAALKTNRI
jgi:hypothetical protein